MYPRRTEAYRAKRKLPKSSITYPSSVLRGGAVQKLGRETLTSNIAMASSISEFIETAYGPRGMKKLIVTRDPTGWAPVPIDATSDGAFILNKVEFQHPIGKMMADLSKAIDEEVDDGVKTAIIIAGKLLEKAQCLVDEGLHPMTIINGYQRARKKAIEVLEKMAISINLHDECMLKNVAMTAMSNKLPTNVHEHVASIIVKAVNHILEEGAGSNKLDIDNAKIEKQGGASLLESCFVDGFIVSYPMTRSGMPRRVKNAKIALVARPIEAVSMGDYSKWGRSVMINISKPWQMKAFTEEERGIVRRIVDKITSCGANVVICRVGIDDFALSLFAKKGILACKRVLTPEITKIERAAGGRLIWNLDELTSEALGEAELVSIEKLGGKEYLIIKGCKKLKAVSIMLRGGMKYTIDEAERAIRDGFCAIREVLRNPKVIFGSGASEAEMALRIKEYSMKVGKREQLAMRAFAEALEAIAVTLAKNCGLDPVDALIEMRMRHARGESWTGIDAYKRTIADVRDLCVYEPKAVKLQAINSAYEIAKAVLRIDYSVTAKPTREAKPRKPLEPEEVEELERRMVPRVMEATKPEYKERWEKGLRR